MKHISGSTKLTGVFGYPISHTLSPAMHNSAYEYLGLDYVYLPFSIKPENLQVAIKSLKIFNICGVNVTVPHKEKAIKYLDKLDRTAEKVKAVNTVILKSGKLYGYSTDGIGFVKSLGNKINPVNKNVLLLGAGGAGASVCMSLVEKGIKGIFVYDVDIGKSKRLVGRIFSLDKNCNFWADYIKTFSKIKSIISEIDILVNATPVGMHEGDKCVINPDWLHNRLFVYDVVYNRKTELLKQAEKIGCLTMGGLEMLLYQGAASFELWTNKKAPIEIMRSALKEAIGML